MERATDRPTFSLAGIPVRVEPWFFLIIALLGLSYGEPIFIASWVAIAFVSVLLHEMGHAVAFRAFGIRPSVLLHGFGGLTSGQGELTPWRSIAVSLAGPLTPLVLIGLPATYAWIGMDGGDGEILLGQVVFINVAWSVLNLVPVLPLDGGNVTASLAELVVPGRGRRVAAVISLVALAGLGVLALSAGYVFGLFLAVWFGYSNLQELRAGRSDEAGAELVAAQRALLSGRPDLAEHHARAALDSRPGGQLEAWSEELVGWARLWQSDPAGGGSDGGPSLGAARAFASRPREEARTMAAWALVNDPNPMARQLLVVVLAQLGEAVQVAGEVAAAGAADRLAELRDVLTRFGRPEEAARVAAHL